MASARIILITDFIGYSGTKTYFFILTEYLLKKKCALTVYLAVKDALTSEEYESFKSRSVEFKYLPKILLTNNQLLKRLRINKLLQFIFLIRLAYQGKPINSSAHQLIISSSHPFFFITGAFLWRRKFVYIQHTYPQGSPSGWTHWIEGWRSRFYKKLGSKRFTFITVSKESKRVHQDLLKLTDTVFPVRVVYNPCKIEHKVLKGDGKKMVLTNGHLVHWKNPGFWVEVACKIAESDPEVEFFWAGSGELENEISQKIPDSLKSRVRLAGYVKDVSDLLSQAAVYFQPSLVDSLPISVVEALAYRLPVVVSNRGGLPELVENGKTGFVVELEVDQAVEKIRFLLNNPGESREMGESGYQKYLKEFTPEIWEQKMDEILVPSVLS